MLAFEKRHLVTIHKGLKRVILAIVHVKKHHMLGHVLAFGLGIFHANCQGGAGV
jgi:hypothetical protein